MTEAETNQKKLAALDLLCPVREHGKRHIWEVTRDGETVRLEDVPIEGQDRPVTFYTVFNLNIPAEVRDDFTNSIFTMSESGELEIGAKEIRTISWRIMPTQALKKLAIGGGIEDGVWPLRSEGGAIIPAGVPKKGQAQAELISSLDMRSIHTLLAQACEAHLGEKLENPLAAAVEDAGNAPTSAGES